MSEEKKAADAKQENASGSFTVNWPIDVGGTVLEPGKRYNAKSLKLTAKQLKALKEQGAIK